MGKEDSVRTVFITLLLNLCPGCQTQSQQCKEDQSSREATVKGWHSSCLPTVPGPAPPATGLSTPLHLQPHSIAESEEGQLHCSLSPGPAVLYCLSSHSWLRLPRVKSDHHLTAEPHCPEGLLLLGMAGSQSQTFHWGGQGGDSRLRVTEVHLLVQTAQCVEGGVCVLLYK